MVLDLFYVTTRRSRSAFLKVSGFALLLGGISACVVYPEHEWDPFHFTHKPKHFWDSLDNQREYMKRLESHFHVKEPKDWLSVNVAHFTKEGGLTLFRKHPSFQALLRAMYPEESWDAFQCRTPRRYWEDSGNVRAFLEGFAKKKGMLQPEDWLSVSHGSIKEVPGGSGFLSWYNYSLIRALEMAYPEVSWRQMKDEKLSVKAAAKEPLMNVAEMRQTFDAIGKELGVQHLDDWYKVSVSDIKKRSSFIRKFPNKLECFRTGESLR